MKYRIKNPYQNIGKGKGGKRDCQPRLEFILSKLPENTLSVVDIGSAEGFYVKEFAKLNKENKIISIEASDFMVEAQRNYIKDVEEQVELFHTALSIDNIDTLIPEKVDVVLLLAVLHWFEDPDIILKKISEKCDILFLELPNIDANDSHNLEFRARIKSDFNNIKKYVEEVTGFKSKGYKTMNSHQKSKRTTYMFEREY